MKNKFLLFLIAFTVLTSCSNDENTTLPSSTHQAGVVITLDDDYVTDWQMAHTILKDYSWRATFCVSKINQLSPEKINTLVAFQNYGHEIAAHGLNHLNATSMASEDYFNQEITPMMTLMNSHNFSVTSFAYPFGARNTTTDSKLFTAYKVLRGTTYGATTPSQQRCYYNNSNLVYGLGIDNNYPHFSIPYFIQLLHYAKANNKILILYAHKPVITSTDDYQTEMNTLIQICQYVKNNNMKFYTLSELYNLQ